MYVERTRVNGALADPRTWTLREERMKPWWKMNGEWLISTFGGPLGSPVGLSLLGSGYAGTSVVSVPAVEPRGTEKNWENWEKSKEERKKGGKKKRGERFQTVREVMQGHLRVTCTPAVSVAVEQVPPRYRPPVVSNIHSTVWVQHTYRINYTVNMMIIMILYVHLMIHIQLNGMYMCSNALACWPLDPVQYCT